jgi:acyl-coenzyme A thioesterase PaaI-like protein
MRRQLGPRLEPFTAACLRQPKGGPLTARATVVHRGRLILSAECVICDADGRDLARATATYMLVPVPS